MARELSVCVAYSYVHSELQLIRLPSIFVKFPNLTKSDGCQILLLPTIFGENGWGTFCLSGPYLRAQRIAAHSAPVNFCQIFKSDKIRGPRQRLVEKWLSPRRTDFDILLLPAIFGENGWGTFCLCGP